MSNGNACSNSTAKLSLICRDMGKAGQGRGEDSVGFLASESPPRHTAIFRNHRGSLGHHPGEFRSYRFNLRAGTLRPPGIVFYRVRESKCRSVGAALRLLFRPTT